MSDVVIATSDAWLQEQLGPFFVREGDRWLADDPIVKRHPNAFRSENDRDVHRSTVESATAGPGEKRPVNRSK